MSQIGEDHCSACQRWQLELNGIQSPFFLEGIMCQAIHQFKYNNFKALAFPLAQLFAEYLEARPLPVEVIVPVPLHRRRLQERGYNPSGPLAFELGRLIDLLVVEDSLLRLRDTIDQVQAPDTEIRRKNVLGALACCNGELERKKVLLIDDVCTTGATLDSCAFAMDRVGVDSVWGLTLAREI